MDKEFEIRFIADNDAKRSKGLMFAEPLEDNEVVFFIFPHSDFLSLTCFDLHGAALYPSLPQFLHLPLNCELNKALFLPKWPFCPVESPPLQIVG